LKHIEERNDVQCEPTKNTTKENRKKMQGRRKALKREKIKAKNETAKKACKKMQG
jgi:hypothetical protein